MRKLSIALFALTTLLLCLVRPALADQTQIFKGVFSFPIISVTTLDATHELFYVSVPGQATLLGNFVGTASFILDTSDFTYIGQYWWPAATGGAIYGFFGGEFLPTGTANVVNNVEWVTIDGGTGPFAGARGLFGAGGQLDTATLTVVAPCPFYGVITLRGSH